MEARIKAAAEALFDIEHHNFGLRLGLIDGGRKVVDLDVLREVVYSVDELSWMGDGKATTLAVQMIGLVWEHGEAQVKESLREFFIVALSRMGVSPSSSMLDDGFRREGRYKAFASYSGELAALAMQLEFHTRIGGVEYFLTRFQSQVLDQIATNRIVGISAPTSAGKSFAIYLAIARHALSAGGSVIYIVPTISLVNQVCADLRELFQKVGVQGWVVSGSYPGQEREGVFVLTQERALVALEAGLGSHGVGMLVVDEVQNLERVGDDAELRSKILFDFLKELRDSSGLVRIVLSGPRLENIGDVGAKIFGHESGELHAVESPVASLTYSVSNSAQGYVLNQHRELLGGRSRLRIRAGAEIHGSGQLRYTAAYMGYLSSIVKSLGDGSRNIVFSPTADQARKIAAELPGPDLIDAERARELSSLSNYLGESIHPLHPLVEATARGIGFHSGRVPPHARLAVEQAFDGGLLKDVVCTTTLMQGVNLPANVVIIRNPNLFTRRAMQREGAVLSPYEFANLRGRAGRMTRDLVGRTVVLDEESFVDDDAKQGDLFSDSQKSLKPGYRQMFQRDREEIVRELASPSSLEGSHKFLTGYIRQSILRFGPDEAISKLRDVGIDLGEADVRASMKVLETLDIPVEVCLANRYWDPIDLQLIKDQMARSGLPPLPETPWSRTMATEISDWLEFQANVAPHYYDRYVSKSAATPAYLFALAKSAESWSRELPLRKILNERRFTDDVATRIDNQVALIYRTVVYGVPAILKPISDLQGGGTGLLSAIESGSYHPVTRFLISLGMYRETAVAVRAKLLLSVKADSQNIEEQVKTRLEAGLVKLDPWIRRQVEPLVR